MKNRILSLTLLLAAAAVNLGMAAKPTTFQGNEVTPEGAWCWFADPRALHYENADGSIDKTYIGYIDVHGNVKATQIDCKNNRKDEVLIRSWFQPDDHNNPTFLVLPDERVMIFYSRHTDDPCFYYRVSQKPGDITTLGEEKVLRTWNNTTYPSPFILKDDPKHIYLCWRGINWHPTIARLLMPDANGDTGFDWGPYQIVQSTGARPYAKYASNGKDKIYLTYTTGHPDNESPNFVYFNEIDVNGLYLKDVNGKVLSRIQDGPHHVNKREDYVKANPDAVVENSKFRNWVWEVSMDSLQRPVIAMVQISEDKKDHNYYYTAWDGKEWKKTFLSNAGGHFHQTPETENCYSGGMSIDKANPNVVYASVPVEGKNGKVYEIVRFTVNGDGTVSREAVTQNSVKGNARPYSIPGAAGEAVNLGWMNGDYYDWIVSEKRPKGYPTSIMVNGKLPVDNAKVPAASAEGTLDGNKDVMLNVNAKNGFAIVLKLSHASDRLPGSNWDFGNFSYGIDRETLKPYVITDGSVHNSSNKLATADGWKRYHRATDGKWCTPEIPDNVVISLVYAGGVLRTYVDGLLDQSVDAAGLDLNQIKATVDTGVTTGYSIYPAPLSQDQVRKVKAAVEAKGIYTRQCDDKKQAAEAEAWVKSGVWKGDFTKALPDASVNAVDFQEQYTKNRKQWDRMFEWLQKTDLQTIPAGRHAIDGSGLTASVEDSHNNPLDECGTESHRTHIDFQWVVKGTERFGIIDHVSSTPNCGYKPDVIHYDYDKSKARFYDSRPDRFFLFFPDDWHIAKINNDGDDQNIRVIVVKLDYVE